MARVTVQDTRLGIVPAKDNYVKVVVKTNYVKVK